MSKVKKALASVKPPLASKKKQFKGFEGDKIFEILSKEHASRDDLDEAREIIADSSITTEQIMEPLDDKGWNILQCAVIKNNHEVVSMLINKGISLNTGSCTLPLHLASILGHSEIVQLLLDSGASSELAKGICYPTPHIVSSLIPNDCDEVQKGKFQCLQSKHPQLPIVFAISNDNVDVLEIFLQHEKSKDMVNPSYCLQEACKNKALKCLKLLLVKFPHEMNIRNNLGFTPIEYALLELKDTECALILLETVEEIPQDVFITKESTLLHALYASNQMCNLKQLTQLMLKKGPKQLASTLCKSKGNTPLNTLLTHFGKCEEGDSNDEYTNEVIQYVNEVQECIKLLIENGCDPNVTNFEGRNCVNVLLSPHSNEDDESQIYAIYFFSNSHLYRILHSILKLLTGYGACVKLDNENINPLFYLVNMLCNISFDLLKDICGDIKSCIEILCTNGANPNMFATAQILDDNPMTVVLRILAKRIILGYKLLSNNLHPNPQDFVEHLESFLEFSKEMLLMFLQFGLKPERILLVNVPQIILMLQNVVNELADQFIHFTIDVLKIVIQSGGNPNVIDFDEKVVWQLARPFLKCQCEDCVRKFRTIRMDHDDIYLLLSFFQNTLCHTKFISLIDAICVSIEGEKMGNIERNVTTNITHFDSCVSWLTLTFHQPRSLKQVSRIVIYSAVGWEIKEYCDKLPLPGPLVLYLKNITV